MGVHGEKDRWQATLISAGPPVENPGFGAAKNQAGRCGAKKGGGRETPFLLGLKTEPKSEGTISDYLASPASPKPFSRPSEIEGVPGDLRRKSKAKGPHKGH